MDTLLDMNPTNQVKFVISIIAIVSFILLGHNWKKKLATPQIEPFPCNKKKPQPGNKER